MQVDRSGRIWAMRPDEMMIAQAVREREDMREARAVAEVAGTSILEGSDFAKVVDGVAIVPVRGLLLRQMSWWFWSYEEIARDVALAQADRSVDAIVLDVDSGGGLAAGCDDCARFLRESGPKPIHAFVGGTAASAAYHLACGASQITVGSGAMVGSVGAVIEFIDMKPMLEAMGAKFIRVVAEQSPNKRLDPDSPEGRAELQALVDAAGRDFVEAVAELRGVSTDDVMERFGQGLVFAGSDALDRGMVDARGTMSGMIGALSGARDMETGSGLAARTNETAGPATAAKETSMNWEDLTLAGLREHRADLVTEIEGAAKSGAASDTETAVAAALEEERSRVAAIDEIARPGAEDMVAKAKAEGWTAETLALEMVKADKAKGAGYVADLAAQDGEAAVVSKRPAQTEGAGGTPEEQAEAAWERDADLRAEFGGNKDAYLAFKRREAAGNIHQFNGKKAG